MQYVIPDIHGCVKTFNHLIMRGISLNRHDELYLLGDYIDRGPNSKGVLDTIIFLIEAGFKVFPLCGNHEQMLLTANDSRSDTLDFISNGGDKTLASFGVKNTLDIPYKYLNFLGKLPTYIELPGFILVHAGLDFSLDNPLQETSTERKLWLRNDHSVISEKIGHRRLITGHTPHDLQTIQDSLETTHIHLDNGCFATWKEELGSLTAYCLNNGRLFVQSNIEYE